MILVFFITMNARCWLIRADLPSQKPVGRVVIHFERVSSSLGDRRFSVRLRAVVFLSAYNNQPASGLTNIIANSPRLYHSHEFFQGRHGSLGVAVGMSVEI